MYITYDPEKDPVFQICHGAPTLSVMQEAVGGLIEPVDLFEDKDGRVTMYVNEEGLYYCDPSLALFTEVYPKGNVIHGPVIISRCDWAEGNTVPLTQEDVDRVVKAFRVERFAIVNEGILPAVEFN